MLASCADGRRCALEWGRVCVCLFSVNEMGTQKDTEVGNKDEVKKTEADATRKGAAKRRSERLRN